MNKQPFYHRAVVLFTATDDLSRNLFEAWLRSVNRPDFTNILTDSIEVEEIDAEPGDPADLL